MASFLVKLARRPFLGALALAVAAKMMVGAALAAPDEAAAEGVVRQLVAQVFHLMGEGSDPSVAAARIAPVVEQRADIKLLGRLILGRHWRTATPEQRAEYEALFRDYMLSTFVQRLRPYIGTHVGTLEDRFAISKSHALNRRDVLVRSTLVPPSSAPLQVDWRLRERDGELVIIDLVVEGVSLLVTHRSEFAAVLNRGGMEGLLAELRGRVTEAA